MMLSTRTHRAAAAAPAIRARQARVPRFSSSSSVAGRRGGVAMRAAADAGAGGDAEEGEEEWPQPASEEIKRAAARAAVDRFVKAGDVVGIGTGELVGYAVEHLARQAATGALAGVVAVPTCDVAAQEAAFQGLALSNLGDHPQVDVLLEQADQLDAEANALLKGVRAAPVQPDLPSLVGTLGAAKRLVVLADAADVVPRLCASLPVAVAADRWEEVAEELDDIFLGDAELWRRPAEGTANPRGGENPYVSPDGSHALVDIRFYEGLRLFGEEEKYDRISNEIWAVSGVMGHGLVVGRAAAAVIADPQAGVVVRDMAAPAASSEQQQQQQQQQQAAEA